jgi:hypothetical protein
LKKRACPGKRGHVAALTKSKYMRFEVSIVVVLRSHSSGIKCHAVWCIDTTDTQEPAASIMKVQSKYG